MSAPVDSRLELVVVEGAGVGSRFYLGRTRVILGRQEPGERSSPERAAFAEGTVSREHALLEWEPEKEQYFLVHRSRTNATVLNGKEVVGRPAVGKGDRIKMGRLVVQIREAPTAKAERARRVQGPVQAAKRSRLADSLRKFRPVGPDLVATYRALATMVRAAISLPRGIEVLAAHCEHPRLAAALAEVRADLDRGHALSTAMGKHPEIFPGLHVRLLAVGEESGRLEEMLDRLALLTERNASVIHRVRSALVYPCFVLVLCMGLLMTVPSMVLKGLMPLFRDLDVPLPLVSKLLFALASPWAVPVVVVVTAALGVGIQVALKNPAVRLQVERRVLALPGVGPAVRTALAASFCSSLAVLYGTGVSIHESLRLAAGSADSMVLEEASAQARQAVVDGDGVYQALRGTGLFPAGMIHLVGAGEESGTLEEMLERAARMAEQSVESTLDTAVAALQPAVLLAVGITVGFVVIGTMAPLVKVVERL